MSDENQKNNLPLNEEEEFEEEEEDTEKEKKEEEEIKAKEVKNENETNKQNENLDEIKDKNEDNKEQNLNKTNEQNEDNNKVEKKEDNEQQLFKEEKEKKEDEANIKNNEKVEKKEEKEEKKEEEINTKNNENEKKEEINTKNNENEKEEEINTKNNENEKEEEKEKEKEEEEEEAKEEEEKTSSYVLKYTRKSKDSRESSYDKELIKYKHCLFMIDFKIFDSKKDKFLLIYVHEIAAIYFDEIYEKKYYLKDLHKENNHFRIFNDVEDAKNVIDEILNKNKSNSKKIFIELEDNYFKLHIKILFFDKEKEIILNIPKKNIDDKEKIRLLPEFLKEIQIKMNHLEEDNKKLKKETKMNDNELGINHSRLNYNEENGNNEENIEIKKIKRNNGKELKKKHEKNK